MEEIDFKITKSALEDSARRGTGQASKVLQTISQDSAYHLSPLLRCNIPRFCMSKFIQALSGCDFLTPHDHSKKPRCRFCDHAATDWTHLFFKCNNYKTQILSKFKITNLHPQTRAKIEELVQSDNSAGLTDLLFCASESPKYMSDIRILCPIVAKTCINIERDWALRQ